MLVVRAGADAQIKGSLTQERFLRSFPANRQTNFD